MTRRLSREVTSRRGTAAVSPAVVVRKRDGRMVPFDGTRIRVAIEMAFRADRGLPRNHPLDERTAAKAQRVSNAVVESFLDRVLAGGPLDIEEIQDAVERELMREGHYAVARRYILYREERKRIRAGRKGKARPELTGEARVSTPRDGITEVESDPPLSAVASLQAMYREVWGWNVPAADVEAAYREGFEPYVERGVVAGRLTPELLRFDLRRLTNTLRAERDHDFSRSGLQTLYRRFLLHVEGRRIEAPQYFWMRVAMGLALREGRQAEERAIEFYGAMSSLHFVPSVPTLLHAGTPHPRLSTGCLSTVMDDLDHIFKVIADNARLSKWAGGLGNDWTNVRAAGARIMGTGGRSRGVIPFLKVARDTAAAFQQEDEPGGVLCAYLETWHLDLEDFMALQKITGDAPRRSRAMSTAHWIPDLFMKRVREKGAWTLFNPSDTPELHDLYGAAFEKRYVEYEAMAARGEIPLHRKVAAVELWQAMLAVLSETGYPWLTFKDPSNVRSPQDHAGVVHGSNLCTGILLNTNRDETAVCTLGSVNLARHTTADGLDEAGLARTVRTAMRMLDNAIDLNFHPTPETRTAHMRHRPVGLGLMGFQDALHRLGISYAGDPAVSFADRSMEMISFYALLASTELAQERGRYPSYEGSKWSRGLLPIDTIALLERERGQPVDMDRTSTLNWQVVRDAVRRHGMRHSNTTAIAPTATTADLAGVSPSVEPGSGHPPVSAKAFGADFRWLMECASRRQKWLDMGESLEFYAGDCDPRALSEMHMLAWKKGLKAACRLHSPGAAPA